MTGAPDFDLRGHGLTPREREIVDLADAGAPIAAIAAGAGLSERKVRDTVSFYRVTGRDAFADAARASTAALLAAIRRHHPETCGAPS